MPSAPAAARARHIRGPHTSGIELPQGHVEARRSQRHPGSGIGAVGESRGVAGGEAEIVVVEGPRGGAHLVEGRARRMEDGHNRSTKPDFAAVGGGQRSCSKARLHHGQPAVQQADPVTERGSGARLRARRSPSAPAHRQAVDISSSTPRAARTEEAHRLLRGREHALGGEGGSCDLGGAALQAFSHLAPFGIAGAATPCAEPPRGVSDQPGLEQTPVTPRTGRRRRAQPDQLGLTRLPQQLGDGPREGRDSDLGETRQVGRELNPFFGEGKGERPHPRQRTEAGQNRRDLAAGTVENEIEATSGGRAPTQQAPAVG